ncbi:hypothetical protein [Hydrogenophaga sp. MI9]|uniref:hypothetical protein n=1 Tax=Hydrogenophaga sp. MI9 TaxID=3453719 RepID=UPI003EEEDAAE
MTWKTCHCDDSPGAWLGNAPGVDLEATGLRALAAGLTDGLTEPGEQALMLFHHVSLLPFELSDPSLRTAPRALHRLTAGDGYFKATLWLHLLRIGGIPARMHWVQLEPAYVTNGLWDFSRLAGMPFFYPLTEVWLQGLWQSVDAYVMDPPLFGAVVAEIRQRKLMAGYFVHRDGVCTWDGRGDALQRFSPSDPDSCPIRDMGCFHSHADFLRAYRHAVPETVVTNMAYENQTRQMNETFARLRRGA